MKKILLISVLAFFVPFSVIAAELGCGDGEFYENSSNSFNDGDEPPIIGASTTERSVDSENFGHTVLTDIYCPDWSQPAQNDIRYRTLSYIQDKDHENYKKIDEIKIRLYNWAFSKVESCNDCDHHDLVVTLKPGSNRPWYVNTVNIATHNGVVNRISTSVTRDK